MLSPSFRLIFTEVSLYLKLLKRKYAWLLKFTSILKPVKFSSNLSVPASSISNSNPVKSGLPYRRACFLTNGHSANWSSITIEERSLCQHVPALADYCESESGRLVRFAFNCFISSLSNSGSPALKRSTLSRSTFIQSRDYHVKAKGNITTDIKHWNAFIFILLWS